MVETLTLAGESRRVHDPADHVDRINDKSLNAPQY
jgi:hypothetical protein